MSQLSSTKPRIPEALRALLHQSSSFAPIRFIADKFYQFAARKIGETLSQTAGVSRIFWFGGSVSHLEPAISDIDILVVTQNDPSSGVIEEIGNQYRKLRRYFPMLVDLHVVSEKYWDFFNSHPTSGALWLSNIVEWKNNAWNPVAMEVDRVDRRGWLSLGLFHYARAMRLSGPTPPTPFQESNFLREVAKARAFSLGASIQKRLRAKSSVLLAEVHGAASHSVSILDGSRKWTGSLNVEYSSDASDRFLNEMAQRRWHRVLRKGILKNYPLHPGHIPDVLIWTEGRDITEDIYLKVSHAVRTAEVGPMTMPVVLNQALHDFILSGWSWGRIGSELSWVPLADRNSSDWNIRMGQETFDRYVDRLGNALLFFRGNQVTGSLHRIEEAIREIAIVTISLRTGILTSHWERLTEKTQSELPHCSRVLSRNDFIAKAPKFSDDLMSEAEEVFRAATASRMPAGSPRKAQSSEVISNTTL